MICNYGCGQEGKHQFKNGKWCCKPVTTQCPSIKIKNTEGQKKSFKQDKKICKFCSTKISKRNLKHHENGCKLNPKNIRPCKVCSTPVKNYKKSQVCSTKCGRIFYKDTYDKVTELNKTRLRKDSHYTSICFKFHKKECIICKEKYIVEAHHYDGNKKNNHPTNFIPLCSTHHRYLTHLEYRYFLKECIDDYHTKFKLLWNTHNIGFAPVVQRIEHSATN